MTNRVVITGYGVVSAIGNSPEEFWNNLKAGKLELVQSLILMPKQQEFLLQQK